MMAIYVSSLQAAVLFGKKLLCYYLCHHFFHGVCVASRQRSNGPVPINVNIVSLGYIFPDTAPSFAFSGPPLQIAVEDMQRKYSARFNFSLIYLYDKNMQNCAALFDNTENMLSKWYYRESNEDVVTALISPGCTETSLVSRLAAAWNILFISSIASPDVMRNKVINPTWISAAYSSGMVFVQLYVNILETYNWTSVFVVIDDNSLPFYSNIALQLSGTMKTNRRNRQQTIRRISSKSVLDYQVILDEFRAISRVLLFLGHPRLLRSLLITAAQGNLTNGEYVYIASEPFTHKFFGSMNWQYGDESDQIARQAFRSLLVLRPLGSNSTQEVIKSSMIESEIILRSKKDYNFTYLPGNQPLDLILASYIAVEAYTQVLNQTYTDDTEFNINSGKAFAKLFFNRSVVTKFGVAYFDDAGQRRVDLVVSYINYESGFLEPVLLQPSKLSGLIVLKNMTSAWIGGMWPPLNEPACGYLKQKAVCQPKSVGSAVLPATIGVALVCFLLFALVMVLMRFFLRRYLRRAVYLRGWWQVDITTITFTGKSSGPLRNLPKHFNLPSFAGYAVYKGENVYLNQIGLHKQTGEFDKTVRNYGHFDNEKVTELFSQLHDISHANVNKFIGAGTFRANNMTVYILISDFASRRSFHDLYQSTVQLDQQSCSSFINDLLTGIEYIHKSSFNYYGYLTSAECLVDKYFTLKIGKLGYGKLQRQLLSQIKPSAQHMRSYIERRPTPTKSLWMATELQDDKCDPNPSSDIYSVGIIMYEILTKKPPHKDMTEVTAYEFDIYSDGMGAFEPVLHSCWDVIPVNRPTITQLIRRVEKISADGSGDSTLKLVDRILQRLAKYAFELEVEVGKQTVDLIAERETCDILLGHFLPPMVVKQLRNREQVLPELFDLVTILFSDICGFDEFVKVNPPIAATNLLMEVEGMFDQKLPYFDVYKVEAVADSYMVASGVPVRNGIDNVQEICSFALAMHSCFTEYSKASNLFIRIGIHCGSCAAGVIGSRRPRYCLFGDTVNTSSRMCSHGEAEKIQISYQIADVLRCFVKFTFIPRGLLNVKNKQQMYTYWLLHENVLMDIT